MVGGKQPRGSDAGTAKTSGQADLPVRALIALGNPGRKYADTRHNVGWMAIDALAARYGIQWQQKFNGDFGRLRVGDHDLLVLKPGTFMNLSGHPVQAMCNFFGVKPQELLVLHDDLDLVFGRVQVKMGGGHGGHNGLRSIVAQLGNADFARVRIGVGRPPDSRMDVADWVLSTFAPIERAELPDVLDRAAAATLAVVNSGVRVAMNACNAPAKPPAAAKISVPTTPAPAPTATKNDSGR